MTNGSRFGKTLPHPRYFGALPSLAVPHLGLAFMLLFQLPLATAQVSAASTGLELHAGYGGGGSHADGLVGGGVTHRFGASVEGIAFLTAVVARAPGRAVFAGTGARLMPLQAFAELLDADSASRHGCSSNGTATDSEP